MSVGDFFKRFDSLKDAPAASLLGGGEPAAAVRATDSLIDF
jgi:hypothetical protein